MEFSFCRETYLFPGFSLPLTVGRSLSSDAPQVHTKYFASLLLRTGVPFRWYPTDADPDSLASQAAYISEGGQELERCVCAPLLLTLTESGMLPTDEKHPGPQQHVASSFEERSTADDASSAQTSSLLPELPWQPRTVDWIVNINMVHIAPWSATLGLVKMASRWLKAGGHLYLYGPYRVGGTCVESNEQVTIHRKRSGFAAFATITICCVAGSTIRMSPLPAVASSSL